ncbi:hypothetical protein ACFRFH_12145 [Leifsonia sp. NPDC056824]|uniref:hypothetical protein n=1 Tax=Leifsonia sp. NPDC056824 TaxID=3345953 RepID=UPI0036B0893A
MAEKSMTFNLFGKDVSASRAVEEFGDKAHSRITGLVGDVAKMAAGFFGIQSVFEFGKSSVEAAMGAEAANARLDQAFKNVHSSMSANSGAVEDLKSKMSDYGFTGEQVSDALAKATTGLGDSSKAMKIMQVSADLAKFKNIDLASAVMVVTKGMEGQMRPLRQLGIDLPVVSGNAAAVAKAQQHLADAQAAVNDILTKSPNAVNANSKAHASYEAALKKVASAQDSLNQHQSASGTILDALTNKLKGQAATAADTYAGKWSVISAKWDEIQVKAGTVLLPALGAVSDFVDKHLLPDLEKLGTSKGPENMAKDLAKALGWNGSDSAGPLSGNAWANGWDQLMAKFGNGWDQWMQKFGNGAKQYADGPFNYKNWEHGWDQLMGKLGNGWDQLMGKMSNGQKVWGNGWDELMAKFGHGWDQITAHWSQGMGQSNDMFAHGAAQIGGAFANGWKEIEDGWSGVVGAFQHGWQQIQDFFSGNPIHATVQYSSVGVPAPAGGGSTLHMTPMAFGGIVRPRPGGTPAILGEAGYPEAVVPLTPQGMKDAGLSSGGSGLFRDLIINEVTDSIGTSNAVLRRLNARGGV